MRWTCEPIQFEELKPASSDEEYRLHIAALEWSLAEPIVISGKEDIKSQANWRGRFEPFNHQVENLITFCRRLPVTLLADDVGLGKTISAGLILAELIERKRVSRALVVCPSILGAQWVEELSSKFGIAAVFAKGQQLDGYLNASAVPVLVTTYDTARNRLNRFRSDQFDMIILDEAHKLRNLHGTQTPPLMARRIKEALPDEVSTCRLTGLTFSTEFINAANEFSVLRDVLNRNDAGADAADIVNWLTSEPHAFLANVKTARCIFSPSGSVRAICCETRSMLGLKVRQVGMILSEKGNRKLLGRVVVGKRAQGVWVPGQ